MLNDFNAYLKIYLSGDRNYQVKLQPNFYQQANEIVDLYRLLENDLIDIVKLFISILIFFIFSSAKVTLALWGSALDFHYRKFCLTYKSISQAKPMNQEMSGNNYLPTILMLRESNQRIELGSLTLAAFNIVYFPKSENITILSWIQEHQPDVIILEIDSADQADVNLLAPLKLDWLTRNIPILIAGNRFAIKAAKNLDYDLCLNSPYSAEDLERAVCSLINAPMCQTFVS